MITQIITITISAAIIWLLWKKNKSLEVSLKKTESSLRSAYVKFGKSFEHFIPFIKDFPADREKTVFLGRPIDFISFDEDSVKFIEVKTGQSQLSNKQKFIKKQIEDGKVEFKEVRC